MKVIINSVGPNPAIVFGIIKEICDLRGHDFETIYKKISEGEPKSFCYLPEDRAREWYDRLVLAGATVELDKETFVERLIDIIFTPIGKIFEWEMALFHKSKALGIILFIIDAIALVVLVIKCWEIIIALVFVLSIINIYNDKRGHSDAERKEYTDMFKQMGKWIVICIIIFLLIKPASLIISRLMPGYPVRNGCLLTYSQDMTVGEAFDETFTNTKWSGYKENGIKYVVYTGVKKDAGPGEDGVWQFVFAVRGDTFSLDSIYINGMDATWSADLVLYAIYEQAGAIK